MKKLKKVLSSFVLIAITLAMSMGVLVGCGGGTSGKTEIKIWCEAIGSNATVLDEYTKYFNENNNLGYTIKFEQKEALSSDLRTAQSGYNAPDLVVWPRWETVSKSKQLVDLSAKIAADKIDMTKYNDKTRAELEFGGKIYGIPTDIDAWGIWCNNAMFEKAGIEKKPAVWDELVSATTALSSGSGDNRIAGLDTYGLRGQFPTFVYTSGATLVNDNGANAATVNIDKSPSSESYKMASDVLTLYSSLYAAAAPSTTYNDENYFISEKVAMKFGSSNLKSDIKIKTGKDMDISFIGVPAKSATEGNVSGTLGGFSLAIPKGVDVDKSWKALKWMTESVNMAKYCELYGLLPADTSLWNNDFVTSNETLESIKKIVATYVIRPTIKGYSNFETQVVFAAMDNHRSGSKTIEDTIKYIVDQGNDMLELEHAL